MVGFTPWAVEVLARAHQAATRLNPNARLRLTVRDGVLASQLVDAADVGDQEVLAGDVPVYVAGDVTGLIDVQAPHDRLVLRPAGSEPNPRG